jgi:hypothetical protein
MSQVLSSLFSILFPPRFFLLHVARFLDRDVMSSVNCLCEILFAQHFFYLRDELSRDNPRNLKCFTPFIL